MIVVPVALILIFGLLYLTYDRFLDALRVFTGVPFAAVGGVVALWVPGHAVIDLRRRGLHRPVGRVGARRHGVW